MGSVKDAMDALTGATDNGHTLILLGVSIAAEGAEMEGKDELAQDLRELGVGMAAQEFPDAIEEVRDAQK
jgi:hypothetical protein